MRFIAVTNDSDEDDDEIRKYGASRRAPRSAQHQSNPWWDAGDVASADQFDAEVGELFEGDPIWGGGHQNMPDRCVFWCEI